MRIREEVYDIESQSGHDSLRKFEGSGAVSVEKITGRKWTT